MAIATNRQQAHQLIDRMAPSQVAAVVNFLDAMLDPVSMSSEAQDPSAKSIAHKEEVIALAEFVSAHVEARQDDLLKNGLWTTAVYEALKKFALQRNWNIYPAEVPKKGEYLLDFMLVDPNYGVRVACESQWSFHLNDKKRSRDWAFDKLVGVKGDIKLFIHEDTAEEFSSTAQEYLKQYALLSPSEAFVDLRWDSGKFVYRWWRPLLQGPQDKIEFVKLDL